MQQKIDPQNISKKWLKLQMQLLIFLKVNEAQLSFQAPFYISIL